MTSNMAEYFIIFNDEEMNEIVGAVNDHLGKNYHIGNIPFVNYSVALIAVLKRTTKVKPINEMYQIEKIDVNYYSNADNILSPIPRSKVEVPNKHFLILTKVIAKLQDPYKYLHMERMGMRL